MEINGSPWSLFLNTRMRQVRLMATELTLAVARAAACRTLQEIWDKNEFPQAAFAMGTLRALERGDRKPT